MVISQNKWVSYIQNNDFMSNGSKKLSLEFAATCGVESLQFTDSPTFSMRHRACYVKVYRHSTLSELIDWVKFKDAVHVLHIHELTLPDGTLCVGSRLAFV